jgi:DNA-binding transcriptional MerR regulator
MKPTKVYYSLAEVRKETELPASTLRYWEEQFEQLKPYKDEAKNRYYTLKDIELIKQIKFIRDELHITRIQAIKNQLNKDSKKIDVRQRVSDILQKIRTELVGIRANL